MHKLLEQRLATMREIGAVKVVRADSVAGAIMWQVQQDGGDHVVLVCLSDLDVAHARRWCEEIAGALRERLLQMELFAADAGEEG